MKKKIMTVILLIVAAALVCVLAGCDNDGRSSGSVASANAIEKAYNKLAGNYDSSAMRAAVDIGDDKSYVSIDSNPYDIDDYYNATYVSMIESFNEYLNLPDYVYEEMLHTSSADGVRSETVGKITVVWKYHPHTGMEATYQYTG